jgi:hypothetical protein
MEYGKWNLEDTHIGVQKNIRDEIWLNPFHVMDGENW